MNRPSSHLARVPLSAVALALAAAALAAYPALRGYGVEDGLAAAELYARPAWLWAHVLAMAGFALAAWGLGAIDAVARRSSTIALVLLLPYYGAEAYGLHAVGRRVVETGDSAVLAAGDGAADLFRFEPVAMTLFALGWVALAVAGVRLVLLARARTGLARGGLVLTGLALATYLPQFFVPAPGRVLHGLVAAAGLLALAVVVRREPAPGGEGGASGAPAVAAAGATATYAG